MRVRRNSLKILVCCVAPFIFLHMSMIIQGEMNGLKEQPSPLVLELGEEDDGKLQQLSLSLKFCSEYQMNGQVDFLPWLGFHTLSQRAFCLTKGLNLARPAHYHFPYPP